MSASFSYAVHLPAAGFTRVPWKNGEGISSEIAIFPPGTSLKGGDFLWRLSAAEINQPGDFSAFPGFERVLALVAGRELVLRTADQMVALSQGEVFRFSGQDAFRSELTHGPVKDFGVIFRASAVKVEMKVLDFQKRARSFTLPSATNFFFVVAGEFSAEAYPGELTFPLGPGDALRVNPLEGERIVLLQPNAKQGRIVAVEIVDLGEAISN
ncbi:MAG: HutD family protein [Bacteriovoracia bacterium]